MGKSLAAKFNIEITWFVADPCNTCLRVCDRNDSEHRGPTVLAPVRKIGGKSNKTAGRGCDGEE